MSLDNLIHIEFTPEQVQEMETHLTALENILAGKTIALTPDQRREYGRLGNSNGPWVDRVHGFMLQRPDLVPAFIDMAEFNVDKAAQVVLKPLLARLEAIGVGVDDTLKLLGTDLYTNAVSYYRNIKLLAGQNMPGAKSIYENLKDQFPGNKTKKTEQPG